MRRSLQFMLMCSLLCGSPACAWAQNVTTDNITSVAAKDQPNLVNVKLTGTLTTTGNSDFRQLRDLCYSMASLDLSAANCPNIPKNALHSRHHLRSLVLPNNLSTIGSQAFFACDSLAGTLTFSRTTTSIGASCFAGCKSLQGIQFAGSGQLVNIGSYAFEGCTSLAGTVSIPSTLVVLRDGVFSRCTSLEGIKLPSTLQSIGNNTFFNCTSLSGDINLDKMVTRIGASAFAECKGLTHISMPRALQQLGDAAFMNCSGLRGEVSIPGSILYFGKGAFSGCSGIESVILPAELTELKACAFAGCTGLKTIKVYAETPAAVDATAFAGVDCANVDLLVPEGSEEAYKSAEVWKNFNIGTVTTVSTQQALAKVTATVEGSKVWLKHLPQGSRVQMYNAQGQLLQSLQGEGEIALPLQVRGAYLVKVNNRTFKVNY